MTMVDWATRVSLPMSGPTVEPMSPTEKVVLSPMRSKPVPPSPVPKVKLFL